MVTHTKLTSKQTKKLHLQLSAFVLVVIVKVRKFIFYQTPTNVNNRIFQNSFFQEIAKLSRPGGS